MSLAKEAAKKAGKDKGPGRVKGALRGAVQGASGSMLGSAVGTALKRSGSVSAKKLRQSATIGALGGGLLGAIRPSSYPKHS